MLKLHPKNSVFLHAGDNTEHGAIATHRIITP
jgi:hypothetical protein